MKTFLVLLFLPLTLGATCDGMISNGFCFEDQNLIATFESGNAHCKARNASLPALFTRKMWFDFLNYLQDIRQRLEAFVEDGMFVNGFMAAYAKQYCPLSHMHWNRIQGPTPPFKIGDMYIPDHLKQSISLGIKPNDHKKDRHCLYWRIYRDPNAPHLVKYLTQGGCGKDHPFFTFNIVCMWAMEERPGIWFHPEKRFGVPGDVKYWMREGMEFALPTIDDHVYPGTANLKDCTFLCRMTPYCFSFNYYSDTSLCRVFGTTATDRMDQGHYLKPNNLSTYGEVIQNIIIETYPQ